MPEKKSLYVETTIPSYATARMSSDIIVAGRQIMTKLFWEQERQKYELYISPYVVEECTNGDPEAARKRLEFIGGINLLERTDETERLAGIYRKLLNIPERAKNDSFHLAFCVIAEIDFLLSWNCGHLGFDSYIKTREYNETHALWTPLLVTPEYFIHPEKEEINDNLL